MKIIDKYMVKGFLWPFLWCLFMFVILAIIIDIFSFIDDIVKYKISIFSIIAFYVYYSPTILLQVAPMAVLLSTIYILSNLNKNNEITAMRSSGIGLWRILTPMLILGFIIGMFTFIVNDRVIPTSSRVANMIRRDELEKNKNRGQQTKVIENVALYASDNRIIFARNYDPATKTLGDIIIHQHDGSERLVSKITAQRGEWTKEGWKFYKVIMC
ncbi:MAG: LptF/LptG family permease, partial [Candidatus Omnitrophica bacterium]|nr:LptF/LptG family permease [Candidatus Omnitrophota bacterium]